MNKILLIGRLGRDVELTYTPSGAARATMSLATTRRWTDKSTGERKEETTWHNVVFWERLAETAANYLKKGDQCFVAGRMTSREYTDKDGVKHRLFEVNADELELLGSKPATTSEDPAPGNDFPF